MLVLENLTYRFLRPNVLDIKLGTKLHSDNASDEKRERMEATAGATTSGATGVRLTGFQVRFSLLFAGEKLTSLAAGGAQVWDERSQSFVVTDKAYGKSLLPSQLPEGVARFFLGTHLSPHQLPHRLPVLQALLTRLQALETLLESFEIRIRGGSLLIVVEGDHAALLSALEREDLQPRSRGSKVEEEEGSETSVETSDEEGVALPQTCLPWELRLIDFAHATSAEGEGADEGLLTGIRTVRELVEGLLEEVWQTEMRA